MYLYSCGKLCINFRGTAQELRDLLRINKIKLKGYQNKAMNMPAENIVCPSRQQMFVCFFEFLTFCLTNLVYVYCIVFIHVLHPNKHT